MIRIAITAEAFDAIASTLPLGSVGYENEVNERRERLIWLEPKVVDRLRALREPGESYSDVILRLAAYGEPRSRDQTVGRLRRATSTYVEVEKTVGLDGRSRPARREKMMRGAIFSAVEQLLDVLAAERARPWWRRLVG